ncbi:polygalacturonase At1g48100-like isoform X2 [Lycium barbarum]|uniref:polygalacturonase At1g48100-like isoform X2 n=1 Tax=Lycium barbarum TaxID=112863 RepID=UPI00293F76B8|nr:polygalacturonase At1g48100-like isoform X2 [Lycium barbarum]
MGSEDLEGKEIWCLTKTGKGRERYWKNINIVFRTICEAFAETCNARRGWHWRKSTTFSTSLYKKKGSNHHNNGKSNTKPTTPQPSLSPSLPNMPTIFNVRDFGAKGDGKSDDTKAFEAAWEAACKVESSTIFVPSEYVFLVGPISFSGPYCQHNIVFQIDGTIIAPADANAWGSGLLQWLDFTKLVGITVKGSGKIDGNGAVWWKDTQFDDPIDNESKLVIPSNSTMQRNLPIPLSSSLGGRMPRIKPTALRFYGSFNVTVTGITIHNSPQCHLKFDNCIGVSVYNFSVSSPGDSPNTDGVHLQNSKDVLIRSSNVSCGDDCVSIQTGCTNVYIHNINCGPGHGISIGGLGKDNTKACVSNVTVKDVIMHNTMNGVRIKTWQGGSGSVQGLMFSNIQVSEVQIPIVIDQFYCDKNKCQNQTSAVALSGINYEKITGTYTVKPVHLACSDTMPCIDVTLTDIKLKPIQEQYHMYDPYCWQTFGELYTPTVPPIECLQVGKPSSSMTQADYDQCEV